MSKINRNLVTAFVGLTTIIIVAGLFYWHVGRYWSISAKGEHWAYFGDYFGGVAGPLLAFISIILVLYTIQQQSKQLEAAHEDGIRRDEEETKRDLLLYIAKADEEIDRWLQRRIHAERSEANSPLADFVWGGVSASYFNQSELRSSISRLHRLTAHFCSAVALYRDNIDTHYVFRHYRDKAMELVRFFEKHENYLTQQEWMATQAIKSLVKWEHEA